MKNPEAPESEDARKDLAPLFPLVWAALEAGTQEVREFFEARDAPIDPYLASHIVRWTAKRSLENSSPDIDACEFDLEDLAYSGLRLIYKDKYHVAVRRASNGLLPVPGPSRIMQDFYRQLSFTFVGDMTKSTKVSLVSVMILWDTNDQYGLQDELILACPKGGDIRRSSVQAHWYTPVPHPALSVESQQTADLSDDLDISLDEPKEGTGETPA